ncbi:SOS response-associated peptidase [Patescibacteria group bacterium]|nr:SOS response-associated peptidase [Patescibacteria group bacterium]
MCGRYTLYTPEALADHYHLGNDLKLAPAYNVAPGAAHPVVFRESGTNLIQEMHWGLIPFWAKDPSIGTRLINARADSAATKPAFRSSFKSCRCLIPANGFYEWSPARQPYYYHLPHSPLFSLAGLYDIWTDTFGREMYSFTIITTDPNSLVKTVHDRMPVILSADNEDLWLQPHTSPETLVSLFAPFPEHQMKAYPVAPLVNNPSSNTPDLIKEIPH